jgi:hypothetical protein
MLELLEGRLLMAANLTDGLLTVSGTAWDDQILVRAKASSIFVTLNGQTTAFARGAVARVNVFAADGDNRVILRRVDAPALLVGGAGRDTLVGGTGPDTLVGGNARDWLYGGEGDDAFEGGAGFDRFIGGAGTDAASVGHDRRNSIEAPFDPSLGFKPFIVTDPLLGVYQNAGGETVVQVRFRFNHTGYQGFGGDAVFNESDLSFYVVAIALAGNGGLSVNTSHTHECNLGRLTPGEYVDVHVKQWDGTVRTIVVSSASGNPLPFDYLGV